MKHAHDFFRAASLPLSVTNLLRRIVGTRFLKANTETALARVLATTQK
jgi:hypothetical protein